MEFKDLKLDLNNRTAKVKDSEILLQGKQFDVLEYLINSKNTIITKDQIFDKIWGFDSDTSTNVIEVYTSGLRKELKKVGYDIYLKTIRGVRLYLEWVIKGGFFLNEQKFLRTQLFKFIKSNLLNLIIVFLLFGIFMIILVRKITFSSVNIELKENERSIKKVLRELDVFEINKNNGEIDELQKYNILESITNPKILCIIRDSNGEILTTNISYISKDAFDEFEFNDEKIDKSYVVIINDEYSYRGITIDLSDVTNNTKGYIQLLLNIDLEKEMTKSYERIVIWSIIFGIGISIIASIVISKKSLLPLEEMLKKQEEFVQNVSHELRTPLTIIQAKQELLLSELNAKIIDKLEDISISLNETKRMSKLTKDLMILSRGDSKQLELNKEEVEIDEFIANIGKTYREIIELQGKKFNLDLNYGKVISIDTNRIYQVIVILLDNAMKYTENRRWNINKNIL